MEEGEGANTRERTTGLNSTDVVEGTNESTAWRRWCRNGKDDSNIEKPRVEVKKSETKRRQELMKARRRLDEFRS